MKQIMAAGAAGMAALLLASCGGGGGSSSASRETAANLQLSGTAATGLAMSNSTVRVKCASGAGSSTTDGSGAYSVVMGNGTLPCMLRVTGEVDGVVITLHSIANNGTTSGGSTTAVANLTPLTEMIVAQAAGSLPGALFDAFESSHAQLTPAMVNAATTQIVDALRTQTGIDLGSIDPLKGQLVAATPAAPDQGNDHDKLLDALKAKVDTAALPQVVNQLVAAKKGAGDGALTLADVMRSVDRGNLPACPAALSGKYRFVGYHGVSWVREFDFKNQQMLHPTQAAFDIVPDAHEPCKFRASSGMVRIDVVIGPQGIGAWRLHHSNVDLTRMGYIFPVQSHPVSALAGDWMLLASGENLALHSHSVERVTLTAAGDFSSCSYDTSTWALNCEPSDDGPVTLVPAEAGTYSMQGAERSWRLYAYQVPNGKRVVFGASDPEGPLPSDEGDILVAAQLAEMTLPAQGQVTRYWDVDLIRTGYMTYDSYGPTAQETTITAIDPNAGILTRMRASDGRTDSFSINNPLPGVRFRPAQTWNHPQHGSTPLPPVYQVPLVDLGFAITVNAEQNVHTYAISVLRP